MKPSTHLLALAIGATLSMAPAMAQEAPAATPAAPAAPEAPPAPAAAPAPEAAPAAAATAAAPAGDNAGTIIFFRPSKFMGAAIGFKVRENGVELGKLRNGKYFTLKVAPGTHQYEVYAETKDVLTIEVDAGQTYYVQGTLGMGVVAGRPNLSPSDAATFEGMKAKLKEVPPLSGDDKDDK